MRTRIDRPMENGGWRCKECDRVIPVECTMGIYHGNVFEVVAYKCPCGHKWKNPEKKYEDVKRWNPNKFFPSPVNPFAGGY